MEYTYRRFFSGSNRRRVDYSYITLSSNTQHPSDISVTHQTRSQHWNSVIPLFNLLFSQFILRRIVRLYDILAPAPWARRIFCCSTLQCLQHVTHYWIRGRDSCAEIWWELECLNLWSLGGGSISSSVARTAGARGPPPWWENDYAGHIYENLKKSENESPDIGFESPNLYDRP